MIYGFHNLEDAATTPALDAGNLLVDAIQQATAFYNAATMQTISSLTFRTTEHVLGVKPADSFELQPADEWARPVPVRRAGGMQVANPLQRFQASIAYSYEASLKMTVQDVNDILFGMQQADARKLGKMILAALLDNDGWTYPDEQYGNLTVLGMANGEADWMYFRTNGGDATDNHYSGQAGGIADATDPFPVLYDEISEHPENSGAIVAFVSPQDMPAVNLLTEFFPSPDTRLQLGIANTQLASGQNVAAPGNYKGYHSAGIEIREWPSWPAGYVGAFSSGGLKPLAFREDELPQLQGFGPIAEREDFPYLQRVFQRKAGFGGYNRVGAAVRRVGNATYQIPAGYAAPIV